MNKPVEVQDDTARKGEVVNSTGNMDMIQEDTKIRLIESASGIVAAYVSLNKIDPKEINGMIESVHVGLVRLMAVSIPKAETVEGGVSRPVPAVDPKESVFPDYIICLEDGKKLKMLKRHLKAAYNMTPAEYRERWQLPAEYPMTAPNYSAQRTGIAKRLGLGQKNPNSEAEPASAVRVRSKKVAQGSAPTTPTKPPVKKTSRRSR